jgi:hypothetical protein
MSSARKTATKKSLKKRLSSTVVVIESRIAAKDTLFPEKVAKANKILRNTNFRDVKLGAKK